MKGFLARLGAAMVLVGLGLAPAHAGETKKPVGVVELFTSQGCNSCPRADAIFAELVRRGDLVALAYHIDYWDYLGWKDTLASPDNTQRQYDYAKAFQAHSVYTPQAIINGRTHVRGSSRAEIDGTLDRFAGTGEGMSVEIKVLRTSDSVVIDAGEGTGDEQGQLVLVHFKPTQSVTIERGENTGKTIIYWNAVTGMQTVGMWHGAAARYELPTAELTRKDAGGCAVLLQAKGADGLPGPILGATLIEHSGN